MDHIDRQMVMENVSNTSNAGQGNRRTFDDTHMTHLPANRVTGVLAGVTQELSGSTGVEEGATPAEGLLPSDIISDEVQARSVMQGAFLPSDSLVATLGGPSVSHTSLSSADFVIGETGKAIRSSSGNFEALVGNGTNATATDAAEDIKAKAQALVVTRLRSTVFGYAAKLPIVGSYFINGKQVGELNAGALATETTPLLGALRDPKGFASKQAEGLLLRMLSPLLRRLPDVDTLDNVESDSCGTLFKIYVECYVLGRDGCGWLFTHLQEHSLVIAPTVSLGYLSTTDLAASTIGTAVASVTGYSIIQGFIRPVMTSQSLLGPPLVLMKVSIPFFSSLDKILASAPNRRISKIACAQVTLVTGMVLFPITYLWAIQSGTILQQLGQTPEVASLASQYLRVTAAGLPGHAIGEIAKRYLTSQGLSNVHTRMLSLTAPLNLVLNYLLVDGPIPALRLGFAGAPLCVVLSHNALAIMLTIYIVLRTIREEVDHLRGQNIIPDEPARTDSSVVHSACVDNYITESPRNRSELTAFTGFGTLIFAGVSGILKSASEIWSKDFGGVTASILGPNALATQAVLLTTATTLYQAPKAMSNVSSDRIKKWMTKGDVPRAKIAASVTFVGTLTGVIIISNVLLAYATSWGMLFNNDPIVLQHVSALLPVIALFQAAHGIGAWADSCLGALGKIAVFPSLNASADYALGIPLGVYLALSRGWGLAGLWAGLTVSLAYSCLIAMIVLVRTNWKKAVGERKKNSEQGEVQPSTSPVPA